MINLNKKIEVTSSAYITQIDGNPHKYYNTKFYRTKMSLNQMYKTKYAGKGSIFAMHSFKAVRC